MIIAITIVHNKTPEQNEAQIQALLARLAIVKETFHQPVYENYEFTDEEGNIQTGTREKTDENGTVITEPYEIPHFEFAGLNIPHSVILFQVLPYGGSKPPSYYQLMSVPNCGGVEYGPEDQSKGQPRFFNWGLKRGIDHGADISCYLADPTQLTAQKIRQGIEALKNDVELIDLPWVKLVTKRALKVIGQLREDGTLSEKLSEYKNRMIQGGLKNG